MSWSLICMVHIGLLVSPQLVALNDITGLNTIAVDEDGPAILHCLHITSPLAAVKWLKDGELLLPSEELSIHNNGSLVIKRAKLNDSGVYECQSEANSTSKVAKLAIRERLKFVTLPIIRNLELNSNSKLICKARGTPMITVKWIKWSKDGQLSLDWPSHIQDVNGTLLLNSVQR